MYSVSPSTYRSIARAIGHLPASSGVSDGKSASASRPRIVGCIPDNDEKFDLTRYGTLIALALGGAFAASRLWGETPDAPASLAVRLVGAGVGFGFHMLLNHYKHQYNKAVEAETVASLRLGPQQQVDRILKHANSNQLKGTGLVRCMRKLVQFYATHRELDPDQLPSAIARLGERALHLPSPKDATVSIVFTSGDPDSQCIADLEELSFTIKELARLEECSPTAAIDALRTLQATIERRGTHLDNSKLVANLTANLQQKIDELAAPPKSGPPARDKKSATSTRFPQ